MYTLSMYIYIQQLTILALKTKQKQKIITNKQTKKTIKSQHDFIKKLLAGKFSQSSNISIQQSLQNAVLPSVNIRIGDF